jgi:hypothetical protein
VAAVLLGLPAAVEARIPAHQVAQPVVLHRGTVGRFEWLAGASLDRSENGGDSRCLRIAVHDLGTSASPPSPFDSLTVSCGRVHGAYVVSFKAGTEPEVATIFVVGMSSEARSLSISLGNGGPALLLKAHYLTNRQRAKSGLHGFRYSSFAVPENACIERLVVYDASQDPIFSNLKKGCS